MVLFVILVKVMAPKLKKQEKYDKVAPQRLKMRAKMDEEVSKRSPRVAKRSRREPKRANLETKTAKFWRSCGDWRQRRRLQAV